VKEVGLEPRVEKSEVTDGESGELPESEDVGKTETEGLG